MKSDEVRKNPVTLGAFVVDKVVNGESVQMVANKNYFRGEPKLDKVVIEIVPSSSAAAAMKAGKYDILESYSANQYADVKDLKNTQVLGRPELAYSYLGFKMGKWDSKKGEVVVNPEAKMGDVKLRQAMSYALNIEEVAKAYYDGLRERGNSLIPPVFASYYDKSLAGFNYDPEKAKSLLKEAGYEDKDGDGFVEDPNGKAFTVKLATMAGSDKDDKITQFYIQNWKDVGVKVELTTGRPIEFNSFYDKVQADDKDIDMFMAAWSTGTNPSPVGLYSKDAQFNLSRYTTPELEKLLADIDSKESLDAAHRGEAFKAWQQYMFEQAVTVPMYFRTEIFPVNNRVKGYSINYLDGIDKHYQDIELTADTPAK